MTLRCAWNSKTDHHSLPIMTPTVSASPVRDRMRVALVFAIGTLLGGALVAVWLQRPPGLLPVRCSLPTLLTRAAAATDLRNRDLPDGANIVYVAARGSATSCRYAAWVRRRPRHYAHLQRRDAVLLARW